MLRAERPDAARAVVARARIAARGGDRSEPVIAHVSEPFSVGADLGVLVHVSESLGMACASAEVERVFGAGAQPSRVSVRLEVPEVVESGPVGRASIGLGRARTVEGVIVPRSSGDRPSLEPWSEPLVSWFGARGDALTAWVPGVSQVDVTSDGLATLLDDCAVPGRRSVCVLAESRGVTWNLEFGEGIVNVSVWSPDLVAGDADRFAREIIDLVRSLPDVGYAGLAPGSHCIGRRFPPALFPASGGVTQPARTLAAAAGGWCLVDCLWWQAIRRDSRVGTALRGLAKPLTEMLGEVRIGDIGRWWVPSGGLRPSADGESVRAEQPAIANHAWAGIGWWDARLDGGWLVPAGRLLSGVAVGDQFVLVTSSQVLAVSATGSVLWSRALSSPTGSGVVMTRGDVADVVLDGEAFAVTVSDGTDATRSTAGVQEPTRSVPTTVLDVAGYLIESRPSTIRVTGPDGAVRRLHQLVLPVNPPPVRYTSPLVQLGTTVCWSTPDGRVSAIDFGRDRETVERLLDVVAFRRWRPSVPR